MNATISQFALPQVFFLIPLFLLLAFFDWRKQKLVSLPLSSPQVLASPQKSWRERFEFLPSLLKFTGIILVIAALARPQIANQHTEIKSDGLDIMLTIDTSGSMKALDMKLEGREVDRLAVVKSVVRDFIRGREYDRMGMVVFGQEAFTQCPLTLDYDILDGYLDLIEIGMAGDGTAIGNALAMSVKRMMRSKAKSRVIVLLTDGDSNAGEVSPQVAAELAQKQGIKVYTIAVGSKDKLVPFPMQTSFGFTQRQYVKLEINEKLLQDIADMTGGAFFSADSTETLREVYHKIDALEKSEVTRTDFTEYEELYPIYLLPGLALLVAGSVLRLLFFLRVP